MINYRYKYLPTIYIFCISITIYFSDKFRTMNIDSIYLQICTFVTFYK